MFRATSNATTALAAKLAGHVKSPDPCFSSATTLLHPKASQAALTLHQKIEIGIFVWLTKVSIFISLFKMGSEQTERRIPRDREVGFQSSTPSRTARPSSPSPPVLLRLPLPHHSLVMGLDLLGGGATGRAQGETPQHLWEESHGSGDHWIQAILISKCFSQ